MAEDTQVQLRWCQNNKYMNREQIIRFQVLVHCYMIDVPLSTVRLECLTALALNGKCELKEFCKQMVTSGVFASEQSCRNVITTMQEANLITKEGGRTKRVYLNPDMNIVTTGNIGVDIKCAYYVI